MHGRLKVKTTAQQEAEKKAQRIEKMKTYQGAMSAILNRRRGPEETWKDPLTLKMAGGILMANPDITTMWNIRKETLLYMMKDM